MKKAFKWIGLVFGVIVLIITGLTIYVTHHLPNIPVRQITVQVTPERIARGKYLAHHVTVCIDCHSTRDWTKFSGPPVPGTEGKGGEIFDQQFGFPGRFVAQNITPAKLKTWSDGEIFRAIASGVSKDGRAMFPVMPYPYYAKLDNEDILSIIAYIKSLAPIENTPDKSSADFPFNIILHTIPDMPKNSPKPDTANKIAYGKYLATAAGCAECHTQANHGQIITEKMFSGGREFPMRFGSIFSANLTPDKETGLGNWTKENFVQRFKNYDPDQQPYMNVKADEFTSIMPWTMYAGMSVADLEAIYAYLHSLAPIPNHVDKVKLASAF